MGLIDKKVSIFLDTNVFQTFLGKKKTSDVLLYSPGVPNKYYAQFGSRKCSSHYFARYSSFKIDVW